MTRIIRTAAVAAIMALSTAAMAHAAPAVTVSVADIDTSTPQGAKALRDRTEAIARQYCQQTGPGALAQRAACRENISYEVTQKVAEHQLAAKARATALAQAEAKTSKQ